MAGRLKVFVDGVAMPDEEAASFWRRFSAHMEERQGDLAGFAAATGFASVHPEIRDGAPALVVSRTRAQGPYATAPVTGSRGPQPGAAGNQAARRRPRKGR